MLPGSSTVSSHGDTGRHRGGDRAPRPLTAPVQIIQHWRGFSRTAPPGTPVASLFPSGPGGRGGNSGEGRAMNATIRGMRGALLLALALGTTGCAGMGLEDILGGMTYPGGDGEVRGEVQYVDERDREIEVRSGWGQGTRVEYSSDTDVIFRNERYSVRDLERGDRVSMRVQQGRNGRLYTDRIYVEQSVSAGSGSSYPRDGDWDDRSAGRVQRYEGRVEQIDHRRGWFELRARDGRDYQVTLPYNPASSLRERFRRLRRGDAVRLEGERLSGGRVEVVRFR